MRELIPLPAGMFDALRAAYATPPRAYHHFGHVEALLGHFDEVATGPGWAHPREVWLAMLYHDAVYQPGRRDNEARSAQLAAEGIARWLPDAGLDAAQVVDLIELTARHGRASGASARPRRRERRNSLDCRPDSHPGADAAP